ncbi:MAG: zinc transporter ZupT [Bacteroidetes bacterium]|nr:zinc transporter ZupT [Bacteroidota bacterium]
MAYPFETLVFAFGLSLFAGLSTAIGGALSFLTSKTNTKFLSLALGFSAGVMIYISFVEIFPEARHALNESFGESKGGWLTVAGVFAGIIFIGIIDRLIPSYENPHEIRKVEEMNNPGKMKQQKLLRVGLFTAVAVGIHNFPEGMASFTAALIEPELGIAIAIAIAIHNIPEGIAVSVPVFFATGSKKKAFWAAFLSGLAEPIGALLVWLILMPFMSQAMLGIIFSMIAGIMVFISLDELLPAAEEYGEHHLSIYGLIAGMAIMAVSLLVL